MIAAADHNPSGTGAPSGAPTAALGVFTPVPVDAHDLSLAMAETGRYVIEVPGTVNLDQLVIMLRRVASANENRASFTRMGRSLFVEVTGP